jgi:EAL domain-containing protein (putative c-di-GMP-specific phosphodiesterase class I)
MNTPSSRFFEYRYNLRTNAFVWVSHHAKSAIGYTAAELINQKHRLWRTLVVPEDLSSVREHHAKLVLQNQGYRVCFLRIKDKNKTILYAKIKDYPISFRHENCIELEGICRIFDPLTWEIKKNLPEAIRQQQLVLYFQPIANLLTHDVVGYEALSRWITPSRIYYPDQYIQHISGTDVERLFITNQTQQLIDFLSQIPDHIWVSFNIEKSVLLKENFPAIPSRWANRIHIEILETVPIHFSVVHEGLKFIKSCGHSIYVDDFGAGFSLATYLSNLPISGVKLDKSITENVPHNSKQLQFLKLMIPFFLEQGLDIIPEYIQTIEQVRWFLAQGCTLGQGYFFGKPQPPNVIFQRQDW